MRKRTTFHTRNGRPERMFRAASAMELCSRSIMKAPFPVCFTDAAMKTVLETVGRLAPETGAKGFGPKDNIGFDQIEFDENGSRHATVAVYSPDHQWGARRVEFHLDKPDDEVRLWTGDVHSHPGSNGFPSGKAGPSLGDLGYVEEVFRVNEWLQWFALVILTGTGEDRDEVVVWPWLISRDDPHRPMLADLRLCDVDEFPSRQFNPAWEERSVVHQKETEADVQCDAIAEPPLEETTRSHLVTPRPKWFQVSKEFRETYLDRTKHAFSPEFQEKSVLIVGVGCASLAVLDLARSNPKRIRLCDFDIVQLHNLCRTAFMMEHVGEEKTIALAKLIEVCNPMVTVETCSRDICSLTEAQTDELADGIDLIMATTDHFPAQALLNRLSLRHNIPAVFSGFHAGALGGRIVHVIPGVTPCLRCVAHERYEVFDVEGTAATDLQGVHGALIDTTFIDTVALKIAMAVLERGTESPLGRFFDNLRGRNEIVARTSTGYEWGSQLWDAILNDLPTNDKDYAAELKEQVLFGMEAIALKAEFDPECPDCAHLQAASKERGKEA